ncbi:MAG TPA: phosphoribosylformylglycinamidine synthase subunit PurS [Atribacteraceae bacterium]|nr:phosphoribosylformylglycinamidine synthase subunit PurS [Atribacteraceae bacterium]
MEYIGRITVTLKEGVFDPQGVTIKNALHSLAFAGIREVRTGKYFEAVCQAADLPEAEAAIDSMCARLLANPVIEKYTFTVDRISGETVL